ncbi:MAG: hypothetical protein ACI3ZF_00990 [Candidatus Cryptobacteroides sp.]
MKVSKKALIVLAGILWLVAGVNVVRMGIKTWMGLAEPWNWLLFLGAGITFIPFAAMFLRLSSKNILRIGALEEDRIYFWRCLSLKSYLIMIFMISFGVVLRNFTSVSRDFIAAFYVGLGSALFSAGVAYFYKLCKS